MGFVLAAGIGYAAWAARRQGCEARDVRALRVSSGLCALGGVAVAVLELLLPSG
ncbi:MAG: hypothetical protein ACT6SC_21075 [Blastomonas fulva]